MFYKINQGRKRSGFTLIELLVVIAIIGILSAVVLASLNTARQKARDAKRIADVKQVQLALELYFDDSGNAYPATLAPLRPDYIPVIPLDPNGSAYSYAALLVSGNCTDYHLGATLENANNPVLANDSDAAASTSICTGSVTDFDGADPVFDVTP